MSIFKFNNFINEEVKYYIFEKPFRIDDLMKSKFYSEKILKKWANEFNFDKWAIGLFISKKEINPNAFIETPFKRKEDRNVKTSDLTLDLEEGENLEEVEVEEIDIKELLEKIPNKIELRLSSKGTKNKIYFDDSSKGNKGFLIEESKIKYGGDEFYLFLFERGMNDSKRARQLHGFVYEKEVKTKFKLKETTKGEKWDAVGYLNTDYIKERMEDSKVSISKNGIISPVNNIELIESNFDTKSDFNWSIKACSVKSSSVYFADFKRISGLKMDDNGNLNLNKKELSKYILVVGKHEKGEFIKEYVISIDVDKWLSYLPNVKNVNVIKQLEEMYSELPKHRVKNGKGTSSKEWKEFCSKYGKITENTDISLNFKRDTKGQLRIQSSMSNNGFNRLLKENDHIIIEKF